MNTQLETITPRIAAEYMKFNSANRKLRATYVAYLANEIIAGRWRTTNQGIAFLENGTLADGQHRLSAIIEAGESATMLVTRGLSADSMSAIDTGAKRTVSDFLHLHRGISDANLACAASRQIVSTLFSFQNYTLPASVVEIVLEKYGKDIAECSSATKAFKPARKAWVVSVLAMARHAHSSTIDRLLNGIGTGEGIYIGDPAHTMRKWLMDGSSQLLGGGYYRPRVEALFNILYHQVAGSKCRMAKQGSNGLLFFASSEKRFTEIIRGEISHMI
jgi:hypothetical protein